MLVGAQSQSGVLRPVDVQHLPKARPRLPPPAMLAPRALRAHQAWLLQRSFHKAARKLHPVLSDRNLLEVAHSEVQIPLAIQPQDSLDLFERRASRRRAPVSAISQAALAPRASFRSCHRRMLRALIWQISAAAPHVISRLIGLAITSGLFIDRSRATGVIPTSMSLMDPGYTADG
ncbi:MAG: hypothetical protein P8R42_22465 [Candidatus Binatia bacterium]|nr:hypothetical protein [Candidatus Binatia bacterium]